MIKNFEIVDESKDNSNNSVCINQEDDNYFDIILKHSPKEYQNMYEDLLDMDKDFDAFEEKYKDDQNKLDQFFNYYFGYERVDGDDPDEGPSIKEILGDVKLPGEISHIYIDYPLSCTVKVNVYGEKTYYDLINDIREAYKCIYDFEENSSTIKSDYIKGTFNRNKTNGKFGIWGHEIGDLVFEDILINDDGSVDLIIGS